MNRAIATKVAALLATFSLVGTVDCTSPSVNAVGSGCTPDPTVEGCSGSAGFSCSTNIAPDQADPTLVCSNGVPGGRGLILYCCVPFQSTSCAPDPTVRDCPGSSIGFSCTGSQTPEDADPNLVCGPGTVGNAGALLYCCSD
jgi:hypothetical protein